jgi:uncharacterized protein YndB with AHSA1/START domain
MTRPNDPPNAASFELTIRRVFDAPRSLVFGIWTDPAHMKQWWGPRGYTTLSCEIDLRPGGKWRVESRRDDDGSGTAEEGVFREIVAPERLVFTHVWDSEKGKPGSETLVTVTFTEQAGQTTMTFHQAPFTSVEVRDGHEEGWSQSFDMLAEHLANV